MNFVLKVLREQFLNFNLIFRLSTYEIISKNQMNYLGLLWQIINPLIQVGVYWFVFGLGIRKGLPVGDTPFFVWFLIGIVPWFFISPSITQGSNSVYTKVNLVSKMKFPVSVLPTISIVSNLFNLIVMSIVLTIVLLIYKISPGLYIIQLPYYIICMFVLLFAITLLTSTISMIIRDFQLLIQSMVRLGFFLLPIFWDPSQLSHYLQTILKINPLYYIIEGFRNTLLGRDWFFNDLSYTVYFWIFTLFILLVGSGLHLKFRNKFVDYL
jgi:teichoic acid transport system permease protein